MNNILKFDSTECCTKKYPGSEIVKVFTILLILSFLISILLTLRYSSKLYNQYSVTLVIRGDRIHLLHDVAEEKVTKLQELVQNASTLEISEDMEKIFWTLGDGSTIVYTSLQEVENAEPKVLLQESRLTPQDMAYDHNGNNLYVIDEKAGILVVINLTTGYHNIVMGTLNEPSKIEVDSKRGFLFISEIEKYCQSILRVNMDGTSTNRIYADPDSFLPSIGMTVDRRIQKLFWLSKSGIESSNYDGKQRKTFYLETKNIADLAIINNKLFQLEYISHGSKKPQLLMSYTVDSETRMNHSVYPIDDSGLIRVDLDQVNTVSNHSAPDLCQKKNGECQHLCLLSTSEKYSCGCTLGWQLNTDNKTCSKVGEFVLYTTRKYFRGLVLNTMRKNLVDVIWPVPYEFNNSWPIRFYYDRESDHLYYTSNHTDIMRMKLKGNRAKKTVILKSEQHIPDLSYDRVTGNLYYLQLVTGESYKLQVLNTKLGSDYIKTLINVGSNLSDHQNQEDIFLDQLNRNMSMIIHPNSGYLFYWHHNKKSHAYLHALTTNEHWKEKYKISLEKSEDVQLAIDDLEKRIYWQRADKFGIIYHANFNGTDKKKFYIPSNVLSYYPRVKISVHGNWLYLSTTFGLWRMNKLTGMDYERFELPILEFDKTKDDIQIVFKTLNSRENPCKKKNGGCEQFCFVEDSKALCDCRDGEKFIDMNCKND